MGKISEIFNFDNIGSKIKNLAKWSCWITILLIWIAAPIAFITSVADDWKAEFCWIPLVGAVVGPVIIWLGSWAMYAFGEFVEDVHTMRNKKPPIIKVETESKQPQKSINQSSAKKENDISPKTTNVVEAKQITSQQKVAAKKEETIQALPCPECGEDLSFMGWDENELKEEQTCPLCGKEILFKQ
ncbi:MAG: hypothetical protein E7527_04985 [Ruminococcaceae bacterium]|nr:hypothetical protein [Oscillospiraceae bacterium]